jgi:hypothetical protein
LRRESEQLRSGAVASCAEMLNGLLRPHRPVSE